MQERIFNFCPYCGKKLPKITSYKTKFCCFCGNRLIKNNKNSVKNVQCTICHKIIIPNKYVTIVCPYCESIYHDTCVSAWLQKYNACPMCQNVFLFPKRITS